MSKATALLRPGLLEGVSLLVAGAAGPAPSPASSFPPALSPSASLPGASFGDTVRAACTELGARVHVCVPDLPVPGSVEETSVDRMVDAAVAELGSLDMLVVDGAALFTHGAADGKVVGAAVGATDGKVVEAAGGAADGGGAHRALRTCLDTTWNITRAVVNHAFLPADPGPSPRRIVYLAPAAGAGESAGAALAGLENLSRTLSTEWARYGITVVTIAPGEMTAAGEVAALCAYLASPAGAYFSGCLLDLRGV